MKKKILSLFCSMAVFLSCFSVFSFAAESDNPKYIYVCPLCNSVETYDSASHFLGVRCPGCYTIMLPRHNPLYDENGGKVSGRNDSVQNPKNYYTTQNNSSTQIGVSTTYMNSGNTNYYAIQNTSNQTLNYSYTQNNTTYNVSLRYDNYTYNNEYNYYTYNIDNSQHYYVTNNYNYYTIYYPNGETNADGGPEYDSVDIFYELPDGRNSYDLKASEIWGQYFVYNVTSPERIPEDDGTTLALFHLDGDFHDSSYHDGSLFHLDKQPNSFVTSLDGWGQCVDYSSGWSISTECSDYTTEYFFYLPSANTINFSALYYEWNDNAGSVTYGYRISLSSGWHHLYTYLTENGYELGIDGITYTFSDMVRLSYTGNQYVFSKPGIYSVGYTSGSFTITKASIYSTVTASFLVDEIRFSSGRIYSGSYTAPLQPFDTNLVTVRPENPSENDVIVYGDIAVTEHRVGGVRPTYPTKGFAWLYLNEDNLCENVQIYDGAQWLSVDGEIYSNGSWHNLKSFNMSETKDFDITDSPGDSGGSGSGGSGGSGGSDDSGSGGSGSGGSGGSGDSGGGDVSGIVDLITSLLGSAGAILTGVITGVLSVCNSLLEVASGFSDFLSASFSFIPAEITSTLGAGVVLMVILSVIKFIRG